MPIQDYGVWVAQPIKVWAERRDQDADSPHIYLVYTDGLESPSQPPRHAAINVKSKSEVSELVFWHASNFHHPVVEGLRALKSGFHRIPRHPQALALDYLRGNLFEMDQGVMLPHDEPGHRNDMIDFVLPELEFAIQQRATVYLFGEPFRDRRGMHDLHMNQGGQAQFAQDNGVWQDGAVMLYFPDAQRWEALFFAFASQVMHTHHHTGQPLPQSPTFAEYFRHPAIPQEKSNP